MSANSHRLITQPCKAFTNIFNVFACNCHDNVIGLCHLLLFRTFFTYKGKCLIREQAIFCINLAVMDAWHTLCKKILLLKVSSTRNRCNFAQFLVFYTIRAKFLNQIVQLTHLFYSPSSSSFHPSSRIFCNISSLFFISVSLFFTLSNIPITNLFKALYFFKLVSSSEFP